MGRRQLQLVPGIPPIGRGGVGLLLGRRQMMTIVQRLRRCLPYFHLPPIYFAIKRWRTQQIIIEGGKIHTAAVAPYPRHNKVFLPVVVHPPPPSRGEIIHPWPTCNCHIEYDTLCNCLQSLPYSCWHRSITLLPWRYILILVHPPRWEWKIRHNNNNQDITMKRNPS